MRSEPPDYHVGPKVLLHSLVLVFFLQARGIPSLFLMSRLGGVIRLLPRSFLDEIILKFGNTKRGLCDLGRARPPQLYSK